jgi:hypothetical protein
MKKFLLVIIALATILSVPHPEQSIQDPFKIDTIYSKYPELINWERPNGPIKIALQIGHFDNDSLPDELEKLRDNDGTQAVGITEVELNQKITEETAKLLKNKGYFVEILPATVPKRYFADVFVAIHADGNPSRKVNGFKATGPWFDYTGKSRRLSDSITQEYLSLTNMYNDTENISPNMGEYYAFSWNRFEHAIHPMTPAAIVETGYLTSPQDRKIIVQNYKLSAKGIALGIERFLKQEVAEGTLPDIY